MKRITAIISLIAVILTLGACSGKSVDINSLKENMIKADNTLPDMKTVTNEDENPDTLFASMSDMDYSKIESFFLCYSSDGSPYEIAAVTVKDKGDIKALEESLNDHIKNRIQLYRNYAPENVDKAEKAIVLTNDATAALIMCDKRDEVKKAFENAFK